MFGTLYHFSWLFICCLWSLKKMSWKAKTDAANRDILRARLKALSFYFLWGKQIKAGKREQGTAFGLALGPCLLLSPRQPASRWPFISRWRLLPPPLPFCCIGCFQLPASLFTWAHEIIRTVWSDEACLKMKASFQNPLETASFPVFLPIRSGSCSLAQLGPGEHLWLHEVKSARGVPWADLPSS